MYAQDIIVRTLGGVNRLFCATYHFGCRSP